MHAAGAVGRTVLNLDHARQSDWTAHERLTYAVLFERNEGQGQDYQLTKLTIHASSNNMFKNGRMLKPFRLEFCLHTVYSGYGRRSW